MASGLGLTAVIALASPLSEQVFPFDGLASVMVVLSLSFTLQAPSVVPEALMQRELSFRYLAIADFVSFLVGYCFVGVILAMQGAGVWSIVFANLCQTSLRTVMLLAVRGMPIGRPERRAAREIIHYGTGFTAGKVFNYAAGQGDYFVVGRTMTAAALGHYSRAYQLIAMPAMFLGQVMDRVLFPVLASLQHDRARMAEAYRQGTALVCTTMAPLSVLMVVLPRARHRAARRAGSRSSTRCGCWPSGSSAARATRSATRWPARLAPCTSGRGARGSTRSWWSWAPSSGATGASRAWAGACCWRSSSTTGP